jgi:hypothetical protein
MLALSFLTLHFLSLPATLPVVDQAKVVVSAERILEVNGQDKVPDGLFGVTAYNGGNFSTNKSFLPILKESGIRWVGMPGVTQWLTPKERPRNFPDSFKGWSQTPEARRILRQGTGVDFAKALPGWRKLGITPMVYLLKYPNWLAGPVRDLPTNYKEAAIVLAEYVALLRQVDPQLTWFHLGNEPNARWFKVKKNGQDYGELFRTVAPVIRARNPGVKIGGPVLTWPPAWPPAQSKQQDWYTWNIWTMPVIEKAGQELDFFDFHLYRLQNPEIALEEVQAVTNAMWLNSGKKKPVVISEYGNYLKKSDIENPTILWQQRIEPWQNLLMAFLEYQPDKIISLQIHDLYAQARGEFRFIKGENLNDQFAFYRMIQTWRYFSGKRIVTESSSANVHAFASLKPREMVVVLVNTSNQLQKTNLSITGLKQSANQVPLGTSQDFIRLRQVTPPSANIQERVPSKVPEIEWQHNIKSPLTSEITLSPKETRSIRIFLPTVLKPTEQLKVTEFYSDKVHVPFKNGVGEELKFKISSLTQKQGTINPRLRVGMLAGHPGDKIKLSVNGQNQTIKSDWFQEIPLRSLSTNKQLTVHLKLLRRGSSEKRPTMLRISSVSLLVDREIQ